MRVTHPNHPHPLGLTFASPYGEKLGFSCDVCSRIGSGDQWLYRCVSCEFDVHLQCATAKVPTPPAVQHHHSFSAGGAPVAGQGLTHSMSAPPQALQHHQSFPAGGAPMAGHGLTHSMSAGRIQTQWQPPQTPVAAGVQVQGYQRPVQPPAQVGGQNYTMAPQPAGPAVANQGNGLGNVMVAGFVDGMMQQLGQDFVQTLTGGGGGGGGGGGDVVNIDVQTNVTYEDCGNE